DLLLPVGSSGRKAVARTKQESNSEPSRAREPHMTVSTKENLLAVDLELIARLKEVGSWCGETHVQKSMFLLSTVLDSDLGYEFIIYKHGPFSFDFRDDLIALQSIGAVKLNTTVP